MGDREIEFLMHRDQIKSEAKKLGLSIIHPFSSESVSL